MLNISQRHSGGDTGYGQEQKSLKHLAVLIPNEALSVVDVETFPAGKLVVIPILYDFGTVL